MAHAGHFLVGLVPLPATRITSRVGRGHGMRDRRAPVLDHVDVVMADDADEDLAWDEARRLAARVVAGDDHPVGEALRDRAHQRGACRRRGCPAAEHAPQPSAALAGKRAQRFSAFSSASGVCA